MAKQLELRGERKDKSGDLKRYEEKLERAAFATILLGASVAKVNTRLLRRSAIKVKAYAKLH
jgi:hypothetical protein